MKFTKKDLGYSIVTGFYTGIIAWKVLTFLEVSIFNLPLILFVVLIPIFWILGVNLGYFLGRWMSFFNQFGKFAAIGFTNFFVYLAILNLFIAYTAITEGFWYSIFIAAAFIAGTIHSYIWNKFWVFNSGESGGGAAEFTKFVSVAGIGGVINVAVASFIVNMIGAQFGISPEGWANVGGVMGSAAALIFSFVGFRIIVFKKNNN